MVRLQPLDVEGRQVLGVEVALPKTNLLVVSTEKGYIMCGALDVALLNEKLADRGILAGRAVGVRTLEELLNAPLESVTLYAQERGIRPGMTGREAILKMC
ncbi:YunC family protein [Salinithrix halophila]|uniref:YunC family protein n=1 Tax=Salinithrix halophila TaxID=1485204 RepID=A0ABV8JBC8_9BACL